MANNPTLLKMPLATDGEKATIPETTGSTTGKFSQQYGFQAINALPLQAGGIAPKREDFNGAFNLLGGVAFYTQKGWRFAYDDDQDYYAGCEVIDTTDGNLYRCVADVSAGNGVPSADTAGTYWKVLPDLLYVRTKQMTPAFNTRDEITTSGTYTAPVTGWYKITLKGGGGGGQGAVAKSASTKFLVSGGGGGEGGTTIQYAYITAGMSCNIVVGAGGSGGSLSSGASPTITGHDGGNGGSTTITIGPNTYTAYGGTGASGSGGLGGDGTVRGASGQSRNVIFGDAVVANFGAYGGSGGGQGGGINHQDNVAINAIQGGGGAGGLAPTAGTSPSANKGGAGGNGYVWFEYWAN